MSRVLTSPQAPAGRRFTFDDQGSNSETDVIVEDVNLVAGGIPLPAVTHMVFVSALWGSDTTGDGSETKPYATIAHAQSTITTASITQVWSIILFPGDYPEDPVHLMAFTRIVGWDPSSYQNAEFVFNERPAILDGMIDLGPSFSQANSLAVVTNVSCRGMITLDYVTAAHPTAHCAFKNCNVVETNLYGVNNGSLFNRTEFYECQAEGDFVVIGGRVNWYNTSGPRPLQHLIVEPAALRPVTFEAVGGAWSGDVTASQNAVEELCQLNLYGFSVGPVAIIGTATATPRVNADFGATPETPTLTGAGAQLTSQMRVFKQLSVPSGVTIAALATTDIAVALPTELGANSIESLCCMSSLILAAWRNMIVTHKLAVTFAYVNALGVNEVHVLICSVDAAPFNTPGGLAFNFWCWRPS